ncbi:IS110 family transposase [Nocardia gipuzkoensis]
MRESDLDRAWVGVDIGKQHHQAVVIDQDNNQVLSRRVAHDETALLRLIDEAAGLADELNWAVDIVGCESALLLTLLRSRRAARRGRSPCAWGVRRRRSAPQSVRHIVSLSLHRRALGAEFSSASGWSVRSSAQFPQRAGISDAVGV